MIQFTVSTLPVAQPRQRHRAFQVDGQTRVSNYTPTRHPVNAFKSALQDALKRAYGGAPLDGPLLLNVLFLMPRPKAMVWKKRPMPRAFHDVKPDLDNLEKALKDALKGLAWRDDSQVADVIKRKRYAAGDEAPGVEVTIDELSGVAP